MLIVVYLKKVAEEDITGNCSREDSDVVLESILFVAELLTTATHYPQVALIVIPLTLLRSIHRLNWTRELYSFYSKTSEIVGGIWRKPVLTHAGIVCDIPGVGEFGESGHVTRLKLSMGPIRGPYNLYPRHVRASMLPKKRLSTHTIHFK